MDHLKTMIKKTYTGDPTSGARSGDPERGSVSSIQFFHIFCINAMQGCVCVCVPIKRLQEFAAI